MFQRKRKRKAEKLAVAAGSAMEEGDIETAVGLADAATKAYDRSGKAWFIHAQVMQLAGQYEAALESYATAKTCEPDKAALAIYNQGKVYEELQQWDQAIKAFDTVVELDPEDTDAWVNRGVALAELDRHLEAIASYDRALKLSPGDVDAWANKGNSLQVAGRYDDAVACYTAAINIDPENLAGHYGLCESLYHQEQYEESVDFAKNALKLDPTLAPVTTATHSRRLKRRPHSSPSRRRRGTTAVRSWVCSTAWTKPKSRSNGHWISTKNTPPVGLA